METSWLLKREPAAGMPSNTPDSTMIDPAKQPDEDPVHLSGRDPLWRSVNSLFTLLLRNA